MVDTKPLHLMIDPSVSQTAHHNPVPVPVHLQDDVKDRLDQDVRLLREPVIWCHRMMICAKKDSTPRQTVDFQALNVSATKETHKIPFPPSLLSTCRPKEDSI